MSTTDTAHELWLILSEINKIPNSHKRTLQEFVKFFQIQDDRSGIETHMRLAFLLARIRDLKEQVLLSRLIDEEKKNRIIVDMNDLAKTFQPEALVDTWQSTRAKHFRPEFLTRLDGVSDSLRHEFGFRQSTRIDIDFLRDQIDTALSSLDDEVDSGLARIIRDIMESLRAVIINYPYVDPQQVTEKAVVANSILVTASQSFKTDKEQRVFNNAFSIVLAVLNLYVVVPQIPSVTQQFWGPAVRHVGELVSVAKDKGHQPLRLPNEPVDTPSEIPLVTDRSRGRESEADDSDAAVPVAGR